MHTATKLSMLFGAGLLTAVLGAGPAQASPAPPPRNDDVVGYFTNRSDCEWVARVGSSRWDDASCNRVRSGPYRGWWALEADDDGQDWPGQFPGGPGRPPGGPMRPDSH